MNTGPTRHLETEQKYDADPGFAMPDFAALPGCSVAGPERYELSATYFDTENLELAAASHHAAAAHRRHRRRVAPQAARPRPGPGARCTCR